MKLLHSLLLFLCVSLASASGKPFDSIISDDASLFVSVNNLSEIRETWESHPLRKDFEEALIVDLFQEMFSEQIEEEGEGSFDQLLEDFELEEGELSELFSGQVALALYNFSDLVLQDAEQPDLVIMADYSGSAERLDELMQIQFERNAEAQGEVNPEMEHEMIEERFMGETLYFDEAFDGERTYIEDGYALVDGIFILAAPEERLRSIVEAIKEGADQPISRSLPYQRTREEVVAADMTFYLNAESFMPAFNEALLNQPAAGGLAIFGVTGQSMEAALSLEALQAFSFSAKLGEDSVTAHSALVYREKSGLLRLLTYEEGPLPAAAFVPDGVLSSTVARLDLSAMFAELEALLGVASPSAPALLNIQLQQMKTNTGIDLRRAFLQNFGAEMVSFSTMPESKSAEEALVLMNQVYVLQVKDSAALSAAIEAMKDLIPGFREQIKTREFQGESIHTLTTPPDPTLPGSPVMDMSLVVTRSHLIISQGKPGLIQSVITGMQSSDSGFWQNGEIKDLIDRVGRGGSVSRTYTDFGQVVNAVFESITQASQLSGSNLSLNTAVLPELDWHLLTETYEADDGIFTHAIMLRKED